MPELKMRTEVTHYIDSFALARYLTELLGKRYEVIGSSNDTDYAVDVYSADHPTRASWRNDEDEIKEFLEDDYIDLECGSFSPALQYLADKSIIPYGSYVVRVSW